MSKSRWGGFRVGKKVFTDWDNRKSSSSSQLSAPTSVQEFDYTTAQGIWNLTSTTQFKKRSFLSSLSFVGNSTSSTSTISFPTSTESGDLAVLIEFSTTVSSFIPVNWTNIGQSSTTGMVASCSYKIVDSTDLLSSVTGLSGTTRKIMLAFRPNSSINSVLFGSVNGQATTAAPTNQTLSMSGVSTPVIGIVNYSYTGSAPTRDSVGLTMTEVTGSNIIARYVIFNDGDIPSNGTISMSDAGTNALQSFYLQVI